jgi:hypothetical protein
VQSLSDDSEMSEGRQTWSGALLDRTRSFGVLAESIFSYIL